MYKEKKAGYPVKFLMHCKTCPNKLQTFTIKNYIECLGTIKKVAYT